MDAPSFSMPETPTLEWPVLDWPSLQWPVLTGEQVASTLEAESALREQTRTKAMSAVTGTKSGRYDSPLSDDEAALLYTATTQGLSEYPIEKLGHKWHVRSWRSWRGFPTMHDTKQEAIRQFEGWISLALERWKEMKEDNPNLTMTAVGISGAKAMSAVNELTGGALVPPPEHPLEPEEKEWPETHGKTAKTPEEAKRVADQLYQVYMHKRDAIQKEIDNRYAGATAQHFRRLDAAWQEYQQDLEDEGIASTLTGYQYRKAIPPSPFIGRKGLENARLPSSPFRDRKKFGQ